MEYERVFDEGGAGARWKENPFDAHIRTLIQYSNGFLVVFFSRERLPWVEDPDWRDDLKNAQHLLGGLKDKDWRHLGELLAAGQAIFSELKNICVWNKSNAGMGTLSSSQISHARLRRQSGLGHRVFEQARTSSSALACAWSAS